MGDVVRLGAACVACGAGADVTGAGAVALTIAILRSGETVEHLYGCVCPTHRRMVDVVAAEIAAHVKDEL